VWRLLQVRMRPTEYVMKYFAFILISGLVIFLSTAEETVALPRPRYVAAVTCFNGKVDLGSSCSTTPTPDPAPEFKVKVSRSMTCGHPGKVSDLKWEYIGQRGAADLYRMVRRFPLDTPTERTTTNTIEFTGKRVTAFENVDQVVVMETPKK
jgi:hypothetical protein